MGLFYHVVIKRKDGLGEKWFAALKSLLKEIHVEIMLWQKEPLLHETLLKDLQERGYVFME